MSASSDLKGEVRKFYDSVGWQKVGEGLYQNARYEDLRPVSKTYLHRCHMRVGRFLPSRGRLLLDAGSGPIQYPEYLTYSQGYEHRICADISIRALQEARNRIGGHGWFVVADIAHLPFKKDVFDGSVSMHTIHHLPPDEHRAAFEELYRTLAPGGRSVVVYSWGNHSALMRLLTPAVRLANMAIRGYRRLSGRNVSDASGAEVNEGTGGASAASRTYTFKHDFAWARSELRDLPSLDIRVWRSLSTNSLRAFIHGPLLGGVWLRLLYWLEERLPHILGRIGQYPMILFHKPAAEGLEARESV